MNLRLCIPLDLKTRLVADAYVYITSPESRIDNSVASTVYFPVCFEILTYFVSIQEGKFLSQFTCKRVNMVFKSAFII